MAKADTFWRDRVGGYLSRRECIICGAESTHRAFFSPTYMNGDDEWLGDYCKEHKGIDLVKVCTGKTAIRYALPDYPELVVTP